MFSKTVRDIIDSMPYSGNYDGYAYYGDGFIAFRTPDATVLSVKKTERIIANSFVADMFDDTQNRYKHTMAVNQPTPEYIKGKSKFFFGTNEQLVNARFIRMAWKVLGRTATFYTPKSSIYNPVIARSDRNNWEMLIMPIKYDKNDSKTYAEI